MAKLSPYAIQQFFDNNGDPLSGGLLYTYDTGTTTNKATYTDSSEDTANANPVVLDANGRANVWLESGAYTFVLKTSAGVTIETVNDITGEAANTFGSTVVSVSTNTAITTTYSNNLILASGTITLSLLAAADAEQGFVFSVRNDGLGTITIDPDAAELINGAATLTLESEDWATIICTGTAWATLENRDKKANLNASVAPAVTDDIDLGYAVGSMWYDTTADEAYVCLDNTDGAAVWVNVTLTTADLGSSATKDFIDDDTMATATATNVPSAESVKAYVDDNLSFSTNFLHIQDQKSAGTDGGTLTAATWNIRTLNTVVTNEITGASLATNKITLPAGTYYLEASSPAYYCQVHKAAIWNDSDSAFVLIGTSEFSDAAGTTPRPSTTRSFVSGRFTIAGSKDFELQHNVEATRATDGAGRGDNSFSVVEVYADVKIWKVA